MKNIIRYLTCMLLLLCALGAQAQRGTEFWFAPPWMNSHHTGEADFHVVLSAYDRRTATVCCVILLYSHTVTATLSLPRSPITSRTLKRR